MKILIINSYTSLNNGAMAIVNSTIETMKQLLPHVYFIILSSRPVSDTARYKSYGVKVVEREWLTKKAPIIGATGFWLIVISIRCLLWKICNRLFRLDLSNLLKGSANEFVRSDILVDLGGDSLTDQYGVLSLCYILYEICLGIVLGKRIMICGQSIGPFTNSVTKSIVRFILNKVQLITVREEVSKAYLQKLNVQTPVYLTADPAFLLSPISCQEAKKLLSNIGVDKGDSPIIGISPSQLISRWAFHYSRNPHADYVQLIANCVDYLVSMLNASVILIPHVYAPDDDRIVSTEIYHAVKNRAAVKVLMQPHTASQLKGVIGQCDLLISSRMHAAIASLSMHIPTVVIGYSHKAKGIMRTLGQDNYVVDINYSDSKTCFLELKSEIEHIWHDRKSVILELRNLVQDIQKKALINGKLLAKLVH